MDILFEVKKVSEIKEKDTGRTAIYSKIVDKEMGIVTAVHIKDKSIEMLFANNEKPLLLKTGKVHFININNEK